MDSIKQKTMNNYKELKQGSTDRALCEPQIDEVELYHSIQYHIKALKDANVDSNIVDHIESLFDIY